MTNIVPVTAGLAGFAATAAMGHPTAGIYVGVGSFALGYFSKYAGHGIHLKNGQMRVVEQLMHRSMAANWGVRPLALHFTEAEQQRLIGSIFDAVAGDPIQNMVEQWPILWAHIQRVHFSGIPPLSSMKAMKRAYRSGLFSKDKGKARELAKPVVDAYATLHPNPEEDRNWYMQWAKAIGLPDEIAYQTWREAMDGRKPAYNAETMDPDNQVKMEQTRPSGHLSDEEIERRLAASRI